MAVFSDNTRLINTSISYSDTVGIEGNPEMVHASALHASALECGPEWFSTTVTTTLGDYGATTASGIYINSGDTFFSLFKECFELSADVVIEAIQKVERGDFEPVVSGLEKSYYSYPGLKDIRQFRKMRKKIL